MIMHTLKNRAVIEVSGADRISFLQGMVTNDLNKLKDGELLYAYFLTPQGRVICDVFICSAKHSLLLDVPIALKDELLKKFKIFKLKSDVGFQLQNLHVNLVESGMSDPRCSDFPNRIYSNEISQNDALWQKYVSAKFENLVPDDLDIVPNTLLPLELDAERLNAVDFNKGCYIGQELTARMKYRAVDRYHLAHIKCDVPAEKASVILNQNEHKVGIILGMVQTDALALLKIDDIAQGDVLYVDSKGIQVIKSI